MPFIYYEKCRITEQVIKGEVIYHMEKILLDIKEFCAYLGVGETKARELLRGNNGFGLQIGNRWYAHKKKLDTWINNKAE